ncbi:MAG: hypothetical protein JO265_01875 [Acidimicrobiia bacterium]|nr:hypothetical protein [Acidimicrobiia bacterium]
MSVDLTVEGSVRRAASRLVGWSAYRIIQEALTNSAQHAPDSHTEVVVRYEDDAVSISVVDDGKRVAPAGAASPGWAAA